jgi:hypothetical protein
MPLAAAHTMPLVAAHAMPFEGPPCPTTDGDDAWQGQAFQCHMHMPHRAPRGCAQHALMAIHIMPLAAARGMPLMAVYAMPH